MYEISKNRYYELRYFCMQYPDWIVEYIKLEESYPDLYLGEDPTGETAVKMAKLSKRITLIEKIAREVFSEYFSETIIFRAVVRGIKVQDDDYRKFFWRLDQERD